MKFIKSIIVAAILINPISSLAIKPKITITKDRACQLLEEHWMKAFLVYAVAMATWNRCNITQLTKNTNPILDPTTSAAIAKLETDSATKADVATLLEQKANQAEVTALKDQLANKADTAAVTALAAQIANKADKPA